MLVDTYCKDARLGKDRPTLLDWLPVPWVEDLCARARQAGVRVALAGSLGIAEIRTLLCARPTWFAVRGAVCGDSNRLGAIEIDKVNNLVALLAAPSLRTVRAS
jgi:dihydroneopterin aldolase